MSDNTPGVHITPNQKKPEGCLSIGIKGVLGLAATVFGIWLIWTSLFSGSSCTGDVSGKITLDEYNQIKKGMTYEKVCEIIGGEGELVIEVDMGVGASSVARTYSWDGTTLGSFANITFSGSKVDIKVQSGLE